MISALLGGALIGLASGLIFRGLGRVAGVSGIAYSATTEKDGWRVAFLVGLVVGGAVAIPVFGGISPNVATGSTILIAGFLVGLGVKLANGCTSGHGVCGVARFSVRSVVATATFIFSGVVTVLLGGLF